MKSNRYTMVRNFNIFCVFIRRDMKVLSTIIKDMLINGMVFVTLQTILYVYLFPTMGMPLERIVPLFLGIIVLLTSMIGFHKAFRIMNDRDKSKFIEYQLSLLPKKWLFAEYTCAFCIEFALQVIIPFGICAVLIGPQFNTVLISWPSLICIIIAALIFFSTFFLMICMVLPAYWFFDNVWPRILTPMILLGTVNYPLERVEHISPLLGKIFLLNPATYVIEGLRAVLVPHAATLAFSVCLFALGVFTVINMLIIAFGIRATLDPV